MRIVISLCCILLISSIQPGSAKTRYKLHLVSKKATPVKVWKVKTAAPVVTEPLLITPVEAPIVTTDEPTPVIIEKSVKSRLAGRAYHAYLRNKHRIFKSIPKALVTDTVIPVKQAITQPQTVNNKRTTSYALFSIGAAFFLLALIFYLLLQVASFVLAIIMAIFVIAFSIAAAVLLLLGLILLLLSMD